MNSKAWEKNKEYWRNRINDISVKFNNELEREKALARMYNNALKDLDEEIFNLWTKINKPNPMLTDLHNYNRLSKLEKNLEKILKDLGKKENEYIKRKMIEAYKEGYKALGINFSLPNKEVIEKMVKQPWIGKNFSERIWKDKHNLNYELNDILQRGVIQGKTVTEISKELSKRLNTSYNNAERLVRTETMHYLNEGAKDRYRKVGIEKVKWCTAPDERTCPRCGDLDEREFDINDTPIIPAHPRCRCTYIPIIEVGTKLDPAPEDTSISTENENKVEVSFNKNMSKVDLKFKKSIEKGLNNIGSHFKGFESIIDEFNYNGRLKKAYAQAAFTFTTNEPMNTKVQLGNLFKDYEAFTKVLDRDIKHNFHYQGATDESVIVHELAHTLEMNMTLKKLNINPKDPLKREEWQKITQFYGMTSKKIKHQAFKNMGVDPYGRDAYNLQKELGRYSFTNSKEFFAEAISDALTTKKPSELSLEVLKLAKELWKEL